MQSCPSLGKTPDHFLRIRTSQQSSQFRRVLTRPQNIPKSISGSMGAFWIGAVHFDIGSGRISECYFVLDTLTTKPTSARQQVKLLLKSRPAVFGSERWLWRNSHYRLHRMTNMEPHPLHTRALPSSPEAQPLFKLCTTTQTMRTHTHTHRGECRHLSLSLALSSPLLTHVLHSSLLRWPFDLHDVYSLVAGISCIHGLIIV